MTETNATWAPVRNLRASEEIVQAITARLFEGLSPGDRLGTETELAASFGVSRVTIRDALRELEANGVIEVKVGARGGVHVAAADVQRIVDALAAQLHLIDVGWDEVRATQETIEPVVARLAAQRASPEQLRELRDLLDRAREQRGDPDAFTDLALSFHVALAEASGNRVLRATLAAVRNVQRREWAPSTSELHADRALAQHAAILDAVEAGDPDLAEERMTAHLCVIHPSGDAPA